MKDFAIALTKAFVIGVVAHYTTKATTRVIDEHIEKQKK